jgi:hypothetical protein
MARDMRRASTGDVGFGRGAADVHARAAKGPALDDRGFTAALTETHGKRRAALSRTDHDCIEVL